MSLDEQLSELLTSLGVTLETPEKPEKLEKPQQRNGGATRARRIGAAGGAGGAGQDGREAAQRAQDDEDDQPIDQPLDPVEETVSAYQHPGDWEDDDLMAQAELSLFQTSREHYGVFYRLDLVSGAPHLRIFAPDEEGALKMRCYLVRPALGAPLRDWFLSARSHQGSDAYSASRETIEQHLLFAAGEALKRLFWSGEPERMRFPYEIEVERVA